MIVAALEHLSRQAVLSPAMQKGLDWLQANHAVEGLPARVEIDGSEVFALVQAYETEVAGELVEVEAHRKYIDVQYICAGVEMMGWLPLALATGLSTYNPDKDVTKGDVPAAELTPVQVRAGNAAIFYPEDAHAPKLAVGVPVPVRKIVLKVRAG